MRSIDVIVPAYNEELCLAELCRRLGSVFDANPVFLWRTILVENGSTDRTWEIAQSIAKEDQRFTVLRLARNFDMDGGITAGLE